MELNPVPLVTMARTYIVRFSDNRSHLKRSDPASPRSGDRVAGSGERGILLGNHQHMKFKRRDSEDRGKLARLEVGQIYAELASRPLDRRCTQRTECCQFKLTGLTPYLTRGEALVAAQAWRATGRKVLPNETEGACPLLDRASGKCLVYADRPFACRTHFCAAAGGPMSRHEVSDLIHRLETIDVQLGGDGPRKLPGAVSAALAELA